MFSCLYSKCFFSIHTPPELNSLKMLGLPGYRYVHNWVYWVFYLGKQRRKPACPRDRVSVGMWGSLLLLLLSACSLQLSAPGFCSQGEVSLLLYCEVETSEAVRAVFMSVSILFQHGDRQRGPTASVPPWRHLLREDGGCPAHPPSSQRPPPTPAPRQPSLGYLNTTKGQGPLSHCRKCHQPAAVPRLPQGLAAAPVGSAARLSWAWSETQPCLFLSEGLVRYTQVLQK